MQIKLKIQDLPVEQELLVDFNNIWGANSSCESTSYSYSYSSSNGSYSYSSFSSSSSDDCQKSKDKFKFPTVVAYRAAGGYNPWRKR